MTVGVRDSLWKAKLQAGARPMARDMAAGKMGVGRKDW